MKKNSKNGLARGLSVLLVLILALSLTLTSCADKTAQQKADEAKTAADEAQKSADKANTAAAGAQEKADKAEADAKNNAEAIAKLPDEKAVAEAIKNILTEYVKGTTLDKNSIVTTEELSKFLTADQTAQALAAALTDYAKTAEVLETLKGYVTETKLNELKTEMNNTTAAKLNDYLTKTAADSKYMTEEQVRAAVSGAITAMATKGDVETAKADLQNALASKTELETKVNDVKTELKNMLTVGLTDQKAALEAKLADLEAQLAAANADIDSAEARLAAVEAFGARITTLESLVSGTVGGLEQTIKDIAQGLIDANNNTYNETTDLVIVKLKELDQYFNDNFNMAHYSATGSQKLHEIYNTAQVKLIRALNADAVNTALEAAKAEADSVPNLADEAYAKYNAIGSPILIAALTECENKDADSKAAIKAARDALNTARAAMGDSAVESYAVAEGSVNLETLVNAAENAYAALEAAKATAPATQTAIDGYIPDKSVYEAYTDNADILALKAQVENAKAEYDAWVSASFGSDTANVNIARLVSMSKYEAAYRFYNETLNGTLLNNLRAQIRKALYAANYIDTDATPYNVNGTCLHSTLAALKEVKELVVDADAASAGITEVETAIGAEYTDLKNAVAYATAMTAKKTAADELGVGLIAKIVALGEAKLLKLADADAVNAANALFTAWIEGMDDANIADILGERKAALEAAVAREGVLANAKTAADAINAEIDACGSEITDMAAIKAIKAEVAAWFTTYEIVAESTDTYFVQDNYDLVDHAALEALYNTSKGKATDAVNGAADTTVLPKIDAVDTSGKILHQKSNIETAEAALAAWLTANGLTSLDDIDATVLDAATADKLTALKTGKTKLDGARTSYDTTLEAAKTAYEADKAAYYDAFNALTVYQLKNGETVKAAHAAAIAWFNTYVDGTLGMADLDAQGVPTGFTATKYNKIVDAKAAYDATLATATAEADAVKDLYDAIGTVNVYSYAKITAAKNAYAAWCTTYGVTEADYDSAAFEVTLASSMKTLSANITAAETAYNEVVAAAKAAAEPVKGAVNSWSIENVTIYSYNDMVALRGVYDAWANTYLIGNSFADINDAELAAMETVYNKLVSLETECNNLKTAKKAETEAVKALLNNLNKVIVLGDTAEIEAARAAYNAWLNGTNAKTRIDASKTFVDETSYKCYEITEAEVAYLTGAESSLSGLNDAKEAAKNAIKQLDLLAAPGAGMSADVIAAYKNLLDEAKTKAKAFHDMGTDHLSDEDMKVITKAEFYYSRYETAKRVQIAYEKACLDNKLKTNYESVLKKEFDKVLDKYLGQVYNDSLLDSYYTDNTVLNNIYNQAVAELEAVVTNNPEA